MDHDLEHQEEIVQVGQLCLRGALLGKNWFKRDRPTIHCYLVNIDTVCDLTTSIFRNIKNIQYTSLCYSLYLLFVHAHVNISFRFPSRLCYLIIVYLKVFLSTRNCRKFTTTRECFFLYVTSTHTHISTFPMDIPWAGYVCSVVTVFLCSFNAVSRSDSIIILLFQRSLRILMLI